jgi:predicted O-methyltransferase YrrM
LERRRQSAAPQSKSIGLHPELHEYLVSVGVRSSPELSALHAATCALGPVARNISPPDTVGLLQMLVRLVKAERVLEIGVFTGFTALGMALVLPPRGQLVACELEEKWTNIAKPYWKAAGVSERIELRIGPASHTLASTHAQRCLLESWHFARHACLHQLLQSAVWTDMATLNLQCVGILEHTGPESFDLVFIDANKSQYDLYYETALQLLRPGGVVVVDNVLWKGDVRFAML